MAVGHGLFFVALHTISNHLEPSSVFFLEALEQKNLAGAFFTNQQSQY
jgi:hypothetical protein